MKVKVPLLLVLTLAMIIGYMLGTEAGRKQRVIILAKMGRGPESDGPESDGPESDGAGEPAAGDESADEPEAETS